MSELQYLRQRVEELEQRVKELEARPREYHYHAPVYVPPVLPSRPEPARIYIGDPIPLPWNTTSGLSVTYCAGDRYQ